MFFGAENAEGATLPNGHPLRREMLEDFTRLGVDPCGERGEYHTLPTNSTLFRAPLNVVAGERVTRSDCWALDLEVAQTLGSADQAGLEARTTDR